MPKLIQLSQNYKMAQRTILSHKPQLDYCFLITRHILDFIFFGVILILIFHAIKILYTWKKRKTCIIRLFNIPIFNLISLITYIYFIFRECKINLTYIYDLFWTLLIIIISLLFLYYTLKSRIFVYKFQFTFQE